MSVRRNRVVLLLVIFALVLLQLRLTPSLEATQGSTATAPSPKFAYASLLGGVDPSKPSYRGFLYNILVAARLLRVFESKADFVVFFQLSHQSPVDELPVEDVRLLKRFQVKIKYIPPSKFQGFYQITLEKFRVLGLEYDRVLFLDADVMPLANLDYLFEMSSGGDAILKENLVVAGTQEPSTAGFFMLTPRKGDLDQLQEIILERERNARDLPFPKFDIIQGWGHAILPPDRWETTLENRHGNNWTFYSADADQGLLYHWVKYVKQSVSIVIGNQVQNWCPGKDGQPRLEKILERPFRNTSARIRKWARGPPPYHHFYHFTGRSKPWEGGIPPNLTEYNHRKTPERFWFYQLLQINEAHNIFGRNTWEEERAKISSPPLGRFHVKADMAQRVDRANGS